MVAGPTGVCDFLRCRRSLPGNTFATAASIRAAMSIESRVAGEMESPIGKFPMFASASSGKTLAITSGVTEMGIFLASSCGAGRAGTFFDS